MQRTKTTVLQFPVFKSAVVNLLCQKKKVSFDELFLLFTNAQWKTNNSIIV